MSQVVEQQIKAVIGMLESRKYDLKENSDRELFNRAMTWLERFPSTVDYALKEVLTRTICRVFKVSEFDLIKHVEGNDIFYEEKVQDSDALLERILPKGGWFTNYAEFTRYNEAPMSYHIFSSLSILGAALGRKVWKSMGGVVKSVYPNYCVILIGPTGIKKNTAADMARDLIFDSTLCPIMADKITPEAIVSAMASEGGHQFLYAPEASVFFGKQKYNDGLATLMLRLLDCPERFEGKTQSRGSEVISDVALTVLAGTTPSLILDASASEVASSGFLNRFMLVVEDYESNNRCFPTPSQGVGKASLLADIQRMKQHVGEMKWSSHGQDAWDTWYRKRWHFLRREADELTSEVLQRSFNHVLRTAMLMHLVLHDDFEICADCVEHSVKLIEFTDRNVPAIMSKLRNSKTTADLDFVIEQIEKNRGAIGHSDLVRKVSRKMQASTLKNHIHTLEEAGQIKVGKKGAMTYYILKGTKPLEVVGGASC